MNVSATHRSHFSPGTSSLRTVVTSAILKVCLPLLATPIWHKEELRTSLLYIELFTEHNVQSDLDPVSSSYLVAKVILLLQYMYVSRKICSIWWL